MTAAGPLDVEVREPYASMQPPDAVVALRSLPRRWRELVAEADAEADDDTDLAELAGRRPAPDRPSALEHAAGVRDRLRAAPTAARAVRLRDRPDLSGEAGGATVVGDVARFDEVVDELGDAAAALADELDDVPAAAWSRSGELDGRTVDLRTLARAWVQTGVEHLHEARAALRDARGAAG